jgi:pimeloyl-ACP methyl ester carboxylesterase
MQRLVDGNYAPSAVPITSDHESIEAFTTPVDDDAIDDLRQRLLRTRWAGGEVVDDWSQGVPRAELQRLCAYWADGYDWPARAARLDRFPQFRTTIDSLGIHFVHVRSPEADALPLVLTHGWPGSIVEFQEVIGPLTDPAAHGGDPADAFHVVCPSLPGYGWSDPPTEPGWGVSRIAATWAALMARLGYQRYGAQGGDWGSMVTTALGALDVDHVAGIHLNMPIVLPDSDPETPAERQMGDDLKAFMAVDSGYQIVQSTRPQTVGYGLVDSPVALAAWIVEKLWSWADNGDDLRAGFTDDEILDNLMLYWLPATGASSARLYWESARNLELPIVGVPVGCTIFPKEIYRTSQRWASAYFADLRYFHEVDRGGHFAAFEQPELFVDEIRACFATMR